VANKLAEMLFKLRKELQLSQSQLGQSVGLEGAAISLYESGKRAPSYDTAIEIARLFDVSLDYLFGISPVRSPARYEYGENIPFLSDHDILAPPKITVGDVAAEDPSFEESTPETVYGAVQAPAEQIWRAAKFFYKVNHNSFAQYSILKDDVLLVDDRPEKIENLNKGDLILTQLREDDDIKVYRIVQKANPLLLLPADAPQNAVTLTAKSLARAPVLGKILELHRQYNS
jgi:transcriptional regulator with XRE-family HTH domain